MQRENVTGYTTNMFLLSPWTECGKWREARQANEKLLKNIVGETGEGRSFG